jgi:hypothetical protein
MLTRIRVGALAIAAGITLASCANALAVPWATYDPALRVMIADAVATRDCAALERLLATAKRTSDAHARATGRPNDDLIAFIEEARAKAGCT